MRKLSLLLTFLLVISVVTVPYASVSASEGTASWVLINGTDFDGYNATTEEPAFPTGNGLAASGLGAAIVSAKTIDDSHGVSVNVDATTDAPWFALTTRGNNDITKETKKLKYSFEFYANKLSAGIFHGLGHQPNNGGRAFNNFVSMSKDGKLTFLDGSTATYTAGKWYTFQIIVDIPNQTYGILFGETGTSLAVVVDESTPLKTAWDNVVNFRLTTAKDSSVVYDNFYSYKYVEIPGVESALYDQIANQVHLNFRKDMDPNTLTGETIKVTLGSEQMVIPFTGTYLDKVYTISPDISLPTGVPCVVTIDGAKCTEMIAMPKYVYQFAGGDSSSYIGSEHVVFSGDTGSSVDAVVTVPEGFAGKTVHLVLAAYQGDTLVGHDVESVTNTVEPVSLYCTGTGIDGAAVYVLDENYQPLCDTIIREDSQITNGLQSATLPAEDAQLSYDIKENVITVFGKAEPMEMVSVLSYRGDSLTLAELSAVRQVMAKENGYWEVRFSNDLSKKDAINYKNPSDEYYVLVKSNSISRKLTYLFSNNAEATLAMEDVTNAKSITDIENIIKNYNKVLALDLSKYNELTKDHVHEIVLTEDLASFTTGTQFKEAFERSVFLEMLNTKAFTWDDVKTYTLKFDFSEEEINAITGTEFVVDLLKENLYTKKEDYQTKFEQVQMLHHVTYAENMGLMKKLLLTEYDDELKLLSDKKVASKYKAIDEKMAVFGLMLDKEYKTNDKIREEFSDAVTTIYKRENPPSSGGGGGGSSGGRVTGGGNREFIAEVPTSTLTESPLVFTDITSEDNKMLKALKDAGIVSGYGDGTFRPNGEVRRDEFIKMMVVAFGEVNEKAESPFVDVAKDNWAYPYVASAYELGITSGVSETEFAPDANISRQEVITMVYRACKAKGMIPKSQGKITIVDKSEIADYALEAVEFLYSNILKPEEGKVYPVKFATRIETAEFVYKFLEFVKGGMV